MPKANEIHIAKLTEDDAGNPEPNSDVTEEDPNIPLDKFFYMGELATNKTGVNSTHTKRDYNQQRVNKPNVLKANGLLENDTDTVSLVKV